MSAPKVGFLLLLSIVLSGCYSRTPPIGEIVIDTGQPALYQGLLPVGITLDVEHGAWDLLSSNLLINGSFDLAPQLSEAKYAPEDTTITTPNGYRTFYPLPHHLYGWKPLMGSIQASEGRERSGLQFHLTARDSVAQLLQVGNPFYIEEGDRFKIQWQWRGSSDIILSAQLVGDSLQPLSNVFTLAPAEHSFEVWQSVEGILQANEHAERATLLLRAERTQATSDFYQDSEGNWRLLSSVLTIDNMRLEQAEETKSSGIPVELFRLIQELQPAFLRYPNGRTANGYYTGTYPLHLDSLGQLPIWTIGGSEYTGDFTYHHFLSLASALEVPPILIVNFGFTDPTAAQRVEGLAKMEERADYVAQIIREAKDSTLIIQPGYGLGGYQYLQSFEALEKHLLADSVPFRLMVGGRYTDEEVLEDYVHDLALPDMEMPILSQYLPHPDSSFYSPRQTMIGQASFTTAQERPYEVPALIQKAAFMVEAEMYSGSLHGVTITPTLGRAEEQDLPIIYRKGVHYHPTELYYFLQSFIQMRGVRLRTVSTSEPMGQEPTLYLSLTSSHDDRHYYLKVVNTTRHPLPYAIRFTGLYSQFSDGTVVRFVPHCATKAYEKSERALRIQGRTLRYTLQPFEVAIFQFNKKH